MNCMRRGCTKELVPGEVFCREDWPRLPRHVRNYIVKEQRSVWRDRRMPGKRWEVTILEAAEYLHRLDLEESFVRAKPLTLTSDKGLLGRLADQVLGRVKDARKFMVVVHPIASEPVIDGDRVFVPDVEALRELLLKASP